MKIGMYYFKDPRGPLHSMDKIRWHSLSVQLTNIGHDVHMISGEGEDGKSRWGIPILSKQNVDWEQYDIIKCRSHEDLLEIPSNLSVPLISRLGRVHVEGNLLKREWRLVKNRLLAQKRAQKICSGLIFMNWENLIRWRQYYNSKIPTRIIPTGCPEIIPQCSRLINKKHSQVLFLGSITSSRVADMLFRLTSKCHDINLLIVGEDRLNLYSDKEKSKNINFKVKGPVDYEDTWAILANASCGVVLARGKEPYDNEMSKIYYYLRAGLPVISEEFISNNFLITETGFGKVLKYGNISAICKGIRELAKNPPEDWGVGKYMADNHSWKCRAQVLSNFMKEVVNE